MQTIPLIADPGPGGRISRVSHTGRSPPFSPALRPECVGNVTARDMTIKRLDHISVDDDDVAAAIGFSPSSA
jgi:hypothetical protein